MFVDGLHLLGSDTPGLQGWEVLKEGTMILKSLAQQEKLVVVAAHQADRSAARNDATNPPGQSQVGYAYAIIQNSSRVISIAHVKDDEFSRKYKVIKQRGGQPITDVRYLKFDVDRGIIFENKYVPTLDDEDTEF